MIKIETFGPYRRLRNVYDDEDPTMVVEAIKASDFLSPNS
jgi:hypothetical protein